MRSASATPSRAVVLSTSTDPINQPPMTVDSYVATGYFYSFFFAAKCRAGSEPMRDHRARELATAFWAGHRCVITTVSRVLNTSVPSGVT